MDPQNTIKWISTLIKSGNRIHFKGNIFTKDSTHSPPPSIDYVYCVKENVTDANCYGMNCKPCTTTVIKWLAPF